MVTKKGFQEHPPIESEVLETIAKVKASRARAALIPKEKDIERVVCEYARSKGVMALKFNSMNRAAVPDRLFIAKGGVMWFCEFKRGGAIPTPAQEREHARLRALDVRVYVIDDVERGKFMVDMEAGY